MVLASLLATSAIVPAAAASAEVGGDITRSGDVVTTSVEVETTSITTVNFTIDNALVGERLPKSGELVEKDGQAYIVIELPTAAAAIVNSVLVDGKEIIVKTDDGTFLYVPVSEDFAPVNATVSAMGMNLPVVLTPEAPVVDEEETPEENVSEEAEGEENTEEQEDVEEVEDVEDTEEEAAPADVAPLKYVSDEYGEIVDGEYEVEIDFVDLKDESTGYAAMARHIESTATLVVEDGAYYLDIQATQASNSMIIDYYLLEDEETLQSVEGSKDEYPHTVRVPLVDINGYTEMAVHVYAETPAMTIDHPYPFGIMVKPGQSLPQYVPTYVYKDGTNETSIMQKTYLSETSVVLDNGDGTYLVDVIFPQGQYLVNDLIFDGQTVAVTESYEDDKNTVKIFTVEVEDLSKIYTATFDLDVPGFYKAQHTAQIQFGGEKNPFGDIAKSWAYSNVVSLYNKGIFKAADKFNPTNNLERGHFALMLARAFDLEAPATTPFTDLRSDKEEQEAIKALNNYGIINGKSATTFAPADKILRYEAALMIDRILNKYDIEATEKDPNFTDIANLSAEAKAAISKLANLNIIGGKGDGKFDPNGTLTREEMAKILDNALKIIEQQ